MIAGEPHRNLPHDTIPAPVGQGIRSPELVVLDLPVAGPTSRMLAYGIDVLVLLVLSCAVAFLFFSPVLLLQAAAVGVGERWAEALQDPERVLPAVREILLFGLSILLLVQVVVETAYFALFETLAGGRSPGKMLVGLRVVSETGRAIGFPQALARNLLRFIDTLPFGYGVGLAALLLSPRCQRLGDVAAGTIVVRLDRPPAAATVDDSPQPGDDAFVFDRRQILQIGAAEVRLARETLRRIALQAPDGGALDDDVAREVVARSAAALGTRLGHDAIEPSQREAFLRAVLRAARKQRGG
jgi:uncharacterized RDD family membrane protein YckC